MRVAETWLAAARSVDVTGLAGMSALGAQGAVVVLVAGVLLWLGFAVWPWLILPVNILAGPLVADAVGATAVDQIIAIHAGILAAGCLALLGRLAVLPDSVRRLRTTADGTMFAFAAVIVLGAAYGLARGNLQYKTLVATYEIGVVPFYFFLTTLTLNTARRLRRAAIAYVGGAVALALVGFAMPGKHGGLPSVFALVPLLVVAGRVHGWRRLGTLALAATLALDIVLAGYRTVWVAAGLAMVVILLRGTTQVRRGILAAFAMAALIAGAGLAMSATLQQRTSTVTEALDRSSGYRGPESAVGLSVFADHPIGGAGVGQMTADVYLPTFRVTEVGPIYHSFWVTILANLGLVGLLALAWPLLVALRAGLRDRAGAALGFSALTCGFLVAADLAGPTDGHWELGLLAALTLLSVQLASGQTPVPQPPHSTPFNAPHPLTMAGTRPRSAGGPS